MKQKKAFKVGLGKRKIAVRTPVICNTFFSKARGLMFRKKNFSTPLLFVFKKPGIYPIHSLFCRKFFAIWMLNGKIIDEKLIEPWRLSVTPKGKFDELLEIPFSSVEQRKI